MKKFLPFFLLCSCSLAPPYSPPEFCNICSWKTEVSNDAKPLPQMEDWWTIFNDPYLNQLEEIALSQNPGLESAYQRIIEAEKIADQFYGDFFPQVQLKPSSLNAGLLIDPNISGADIELPLNRIHFQYYAFPAVANYEVDFFGRIRNNFLAAVAFSESRIYYYEVVKLTLTTDIASAYFQIRSLDAQINVLQNTLRSRQESFEVNASRYEGGLINFSDVSKAENQVNASQSDLYQLMIERARAENILAALLGYYAPCFSFPNYPLEGLAPEVAPAIPSALLTRRPDIQEKERIMAAENALIGVARADYFPRFSITGFLGFESPDFDKLFSWKARLWGWATNTSQLIFDAGKTTAAVERAKAGYLQAVASYMETTLIAFREAETALSEEKYARQKYVAFEKASNASRETQNISLERYNQGLVTYLDVVEADRSLLSNQLLLERARLQTFQAAIDLIKALGGTYCLNN